MSGREKVSKKILIKGVVQGVGFRPFVYRTAVSNKISGYVVNAGNMVQIAASGTAGDMDLFLMTLKTENPPLSRIDELIDELIDEPEIPDWDFDEDPGGEFLILKSTKGESGNSILPPDTAICPDCLFEIKSENDRRHLYPFTVCTNCGPRYTTVKKLPYDRQNTVMDDFPLCDDCEREYTDVKNRRYHAQPVCCPKCGPVHTFEKPDVSAGVPKRFFLSAGSVALKAAAEAIDDGFIVALKGDGGFHLACDAFSEKAVSELRKRLSRPAQPFAVMVRNIKTAKENAQIRDEAGKECSYLENVRRPIVVCNKTPSYGLAPSVVPKLHNVGMMLPYSGTHYVLFEYLITDAVVMTSANLPGLPMVIENDDAFEKLSKIADYFLFHNRLIQNRTDDTVIRFVHDEPVFLRRSRGFVPERILLPFSHPAGIAGVGAEMNNTVSFTKDGNIYLSQYIGNTKHPKTAKYHAEAFETLESLTGISPSVLACDMHPGFNTTKFAEEYVAADSSATVEPSVSDEPSRLALHRIQHHHAHICSVMADNGLPLESEVIGIALDGVGYGDDETAWGGEILRCAYTDYARLSSLMPQPMAGGDLATRFPSRLVFGMLYPYLENGSISEDCLLDLDLYFPHGEAEKKIVLSQLRNNFNVAVSTSAGRVLDAAAAMLGLCRERTYDGEPSMNLEAAAYDGLLELKTESRMSDLLYWEPSFKEVKEKNGAALDVLDTSALLYSLYLEVSAGESSRFSANQLAVMFVHTLSIGIGRLALKHIQKTGITTVCISGGVANNDYIVSVIAAFLKENGIDLRTHKNLPPGDGCISHGQAAAVTARLLSASFKNPDAE
ncbi:MAG: carbamoyltransferase HypF [Methanimicrococcus sp.]|nr:carbamoyltransferase HypF [Methanimicrococcus sp.]